MSDSGSTREMPPLKSATSTSPCPCGCPAAYDDCCGRFHVGAVPQTAEELMRSRYSAYVLGMEPYLLATWHPRTRPPSLDLDEEQASATRWLGLEIRRSEPPRIDDAGQTSAFVEFVARYKNAGRAHRLHEVSHFVRENGHWYYVDGVLTPDASKKRR